MKGEKHLVSPVKCYIDMSFNRTYNTFKKNEKRSFMNAYIRGENVKRDPLYLKIYNDLLTGIKNGTYASGSRLPSEKELSCDYDVSRITSKKALEMLAEQNMITRMPGKGSYVSYPGEKVDEILMEHHTERKKVIGVILDSFGVAFGNDLVCGIEWECRELGYYMMLRCTYGSVEEEAKAIEDLRNFGVCGIILMCVQGETYNAAVLKLSLEKYPVVLVDREMKGVPIPCVGTDNYNAVKELMNILFENGHRNICFLSHPFLRTSTVEARFEGYKDSYLEHSLVTNEGLWITDIGSMVPQHDRKQEQKETDQHRIEEYILENPQVSAFLAVDHTTAVMTYKILKKLNLNQEKELVFFDGVDEKNDTSPIFTHVVQGEGEIGRTAVRYLLDRIGGKEVPERTYIPYRIIRGK